MTDADARLWYARQTVEHGWSRNMLALQIDNRLHERQGKAINLDQYGLQPRKRILSSSYVWVLRLYVTSR